MSHKMNSSHFPSEENNKLILKWMEEQVLLSYVLSWAKSRSTWLITFHTLRWIMSHMSGLVDGLRRDLASSSQHIVVFWASKMADATTFMPVLPQLANISTVGTCLRNKLKIVVWVILHRNMHETRVQYFFHKSPDVTGKSVTAN